MTTQIIPLPAFKDNYIWLFFEEKSRQAWVVDPGDANVVMNALKQHQLTLAGILLTHHHHDHSGGIQELSQHWPKCIVFASHKSSIASVTHPVKENDEIHCAPFSFKIMEIPGHTLDHIAFYNDEILFCGDTLFSAGCGRVFEGTPAQMYHSLEKIERLPETIKIFCGHEYTLANLRFAEYVEPDNSAIKQHKEISLHNQITLPSTLALEKEINPFLRCKNAAVIHAVENYSHHYGMNSVDVFTYLRAWKNQF